MLLRRRCCKSRILQKHRTSRYMSKMNKQLELFQEYSEYAWVDDYVPFVSEVEIFNDTFGKPNNYIPVIPNNQKLLDFVVNFILEETEELKHTIEEKDIVEVLDAICDLLYVAIGNA